MSCEKYLSISQAREHLGGVSGRTVRRYATEGQQGILLEAKRFGRKWLIPETAIAEFVEAVDRASRPTEYADDADADYHDAMRELRDLGVVRDDNEEGGDRD
ncbi:MAG: helix-turn-helix domain-containing protein [Planctomycetota bacterium]|jgi:hypothetical protein